jgi:single-strand DNA-binding protein
LAEICSQFLVKGRRVYVEGRLSTRTWTGQDGQQRSVTEVVIDDMILLDSKFAPGTQNAPEGAARPARTSEKPKPESAEEEPMPADEAGDVAPDDIPF